MTPPLSILLVEDNPADARLIEVLLAGRGDTTVRRAETLAGAIDALRPAEAADPSIPSPKSEVPSRTDLILLDLTLPDSESLGTLRSVAQAAPGVPVVVLSGMSDENLALRAVREGAQDYLVKGRIDAELLHRSVGYAVERKRAQHDRDTAQQALRESEERLRLVTEASTDGIWDWNVLNGEVYWSDRVYQLLGIGREEPRTPERLLSLVHPDDRPRVETLLRDSLSSGERFRIEFRMRRPDGEYGYFRSSGKTVRNPQGSPVRIAGSLTDITERKRAEQALRESEQRFQRFMDNSPTIAYLKDRWGRYVYVNAGFEKMLHKGAGIVGKTDLELWPANLAERLRKADSLVLETNQLHEFTEELPGDDGPRDWISFKFPVESEGQRLVGGVAIDITDRRRAERALREADEQLRQSQKMEAVGQLASGVAHDFNNLLTAIRGYASLARNTLSEDHPALESLDQVEEASRQATGVAGALLTFARKGHTEKEPIRVADAVESAARLFRRTLPPSVRLILDTGAADELWVLADSTQLQQVVINLGLNARDAISAAGGGTLTIAVEPAGQPRRRLLGPRPKPTAVNIVVRDTGTGMSPEIKARIFEPFFTTKPRGHGTGLGLAVIHGIVQDHAGTISVESTQGRGSTFTVNLPIAAAPKPVSEQAQPEASQISGGLALLAEDNQLVRGLLASMLSALGFETAHASSSDQAIKVASGIDLHIDLLVVDQDLPGGGGLHLLSELRSKGQAARAVIVAPAGAPDETLPERTVLLRKPFQLADLKRAIAELDSPAPGPAPAPAQPTSEDSRMNERGVAPPPARTQG